MGFLTPSRRFASEGMDLPRVPPALVVESLHDLAQLNHRFGGIRAVLRPLMRLMRRWTLRNPIHLLDLGTGSADIPRALVCWARSEGIQLAVTAVDVNPVMCGLARKECVEFPQITIDRHNLLSLPYETHSFDFVTSSQVLHHFAEPDVVRILQQASRIARHGIVMADLRRAHTTYAAIWAQIGRAHV